MIPSPLSHPDAASFVPRFRREALAGERALPSTSLRFAAILLIDVVGFTDSTGSLELNMQLSQARAASVGQYLQNQGVMAARIQTQGMGPQMPIATNDTAEGRQENRRVELVLRPLTA